MRFGWLPSQFAELTPSQLVLLKREREDYEVLSVSAVRDAIGNALANAYQKKSSSPIPLFDEIDYDKPARAMSTGEAMQKMAALEKIEGRRNFLERG